MSEKKRLKQIGLMLTEGEFQIIKEAAENEKIAMSSYIRNQVFKNKDLKEKCAEKESKNVV